MTVRKERRNAIVICVTIVVVLATGGTTSWITYVNFVVRNKTQILINYN